MTIQELEGLDSLMITAAQAGALLGINPNTIRAQAQEDPAKLGFPVIVAKSRVNIPRIPFLQYIKGETRPSV